MALPFAYLHPVFAMQRCVVCVLSQLFAATQQNAFQRLTDIETRLQDEQDGIAATREQQDVQWNTWSLSTLDT